MSPTSSPEQMLRNVFGYDEFKSLQLEVISNVLQKQDSLAILPTGGGKSLCYQIPALIFPGLTVVVSPLIALMQDQVEQLQARGVPALFLNSSLSFNEYQQNMEQVRSGEIKLLYVAPETLLTPRLFSLLASIPLDCLTIDEAHCISEWGHDFRPEYRQLVEVRQRYPQAVCLALTATATPRVRADIKTTLRFEASNEFIASFNRPNLLIEVVPKKDPVSQAQQYLERFPDQSGIIYCFTRRSVESLADFLQRRGFSVRPYHAGLSDEERKQNQEAFIRDDVQIIVATIAFGMGINKPNVRFILHYDLPKSIESYYQEIGRAGRDGLPAYCQLLYSYGDVQKLNYFIDQKDEGERQVAQQHLTALTRYAESVGCRRLPLLSYFGEQYNGENCGMCDNCLTGPQKQKDITIPAQKFLSCVKRTGEKFGAGHITDVLLGSRNQKILKFGHEQLSTYAIGKELTRQQWLHLGRQLVHQGLLNQDERYGSLKLTPKAYELLKTKASIHGILLEEITPVSPQMSGEVAHDQELFELLRVKRKAMADEAQVAPYVIFSDRTLVEMAAYYPQSPESLAKINGVGQYKLKEYGPAFLELIQSYCQEHNRSEKLKPTTTPVKKPEGQLELKAGRHTLVGEAYNAGRSVQELMDLYGVQQNTILDHLAKFALEGNALRASEELKALSTLPPEVQKAALDAFVALGAERLKPVFEQLNGTIDYDELKILRLIHFCRLAEEEKKP